MLFWSRFKWSPLCVDSSSFRLELQQSLRLQAAQMGSSEGLIDYEIICWRLHDNCCWAPIWFPGFCTNVFNMQFECEFFIYNNVQDFPFFDLFYQWAIYGDFSFGAFFFLFSSRVRFFFFSMLMFILYFLASLHVAVRDQQIHKSG